MPALVYWFAGPEHRARARRRSRSARVVAFTHPADAAASSRSSRCCRVGLEVQTSLALFGRIFEYLDLPVDIAERTRRTPPAQRARRRRASRTSASATPESAPWTLRDINAKVPAGTRTALVGETGSGKTTLGLSRRAPLRASGGRRHDRRDRHPRRDARLAGRNGRRSSRRRPTCFTPRSARTCASPSPTPPTRRSCRPPGRADPRPDRLAARGLRHARRRARLPLLRRREAAHRDRAHGAAQPARSSSSTRRPRALDTRNRARRSGRPRRARARAARRSRSRTACRRSATPTRSSCSTTARSSSAEPTTS